MQATPAKGADAAGSARQQCSKLLFTAIILADMRYFDEVNQVWDGWIDAAAPPARACFQAGLTQPSLKLEMIMIAATGVAVTLNGRGRVSCRP